MRKLKVKEFDLFGTKYTLEQVDKIETDEKDVFIAGMTNTVTNQVWLSKYDSKGQPMDTSEYKITLLHELIHAILREGQYHNASSDEPMVEWVARCLKSLIDQKVIK